MIEMLGVLAIIAVLSVGGIAGYSKAMETYKLNRYREGLAELLSNFLQVKEQLTYEKGGRTTNYSQILSAMNMLPAEFKLTGNDLRDEFGNGLLIYHDNRYAYENHYGFSFTLRKNKKTSLVCQALIETAKSFQNDISQMYRYSATGANTPYYTAYGNKHCSKGTKCISDLTVSDIKGMCNFYNGEDKDIIFWVQIIFKS